MAVTIPTLTSTAGTLSAPGVGSGLDVKGLVTQLMAVEQQPLTLLAQQEAKFQAKLSSLGTIKATLSSLQSAAQALSSASSAAYSVSVSDTSVLSATASSSAVAGSYSLTVTDLATVQKLVATGRASTSAAIGTGATTTLTLALGATSEEHFTADADKTPVSVTIDSENNTLAGIRDAINAADAGVTASIINDGTASPYRLLLTANDTGAANSIRLTVAGDGTIDGLLAYDPDGSKNLTQLQAAQNAQITVDGIGITSASNTLSDAIQGVTLSLSKETASATTVSVQRSNSGLTSAIGALVKAYNDSNSMVALATAKGAVMQGDWGLLKVQTLMRTILGGAQQTAGAYTNLSQLGVRFQKDGTTLAVDSSLLNAALSSNPTAVLTLTTAIGAALNTAVDGLLGTAGPMASGADGINRSIELIGTRKAVLQARLEATQERYQKQFSALDTLISKMNQTSTYLTQQLALLPTNYANNQS